MSTPTKKQKPGLLQQERTEERRAVRKLHARGIRAMAEGKSSFEHKGSQIDLLPFDFHATPKSKNEKK